MAVLLAQLPGPINLRLVLTDLKLTDILHDIVTAKGNRSGVPRVLAVDRNETRELAGTLHLEAPSVPVYSISDNLIPAMTSATAPSGAASASSVYSATYSAWKAFNHLTAISADSWNAAAHETPAWLQYQFPTARVVAQYTIRSPSADAGTAPKTWTFEGSNNGSTWVTLDTRTNITDWASAHVYDLANATAYAYYRLDVTEGNNPTYLSVGELEMMETMISGYSSGKDNAIAQIRAINALVTAGTTLTLKSRDATYPVTLKVLPSRGVSHPLDELFELPGGPVLASCAFSFTCEPYAYGPEVVAFSGAITAPCIVDLGTILGDYRTPVRMGFSAVGQYAHCLYVGLLAPGSALTIGDLLKELEYGDWTGGTTGDVAVTGAHNSIARFNISTSYAERYLSDHVLDPGTYSLLGRARMDNAADWGTTQVSLAGKLLTHVVPGDTKFSINDFGAAALPNRKTVLPVASTVAWQMKSSEVVHGIHGDYLAFMPQTWGYWRWHPPVASAGAITLAFLADGTFTVDGVANATDFRGAQISALGASKVFVVAEPFNTALTDGFQGFSLDATYTPRYALWR